MNRSELRDDDTYGLFDLYRQVSLRFAPSNQQWVGMVGAADDGPGLQEVQTWESFRDVHSFPTSR